MSKNQIAPELLVKIDRLPGMRYKYHQDDGHILLVDTAQGVADRVMVFGKGARALEHLHMAVMAVEGVLAHMGYEDPASGTINVYRWVSVRWLHQELWDANVNIIAFTETLTTLGNDIIKESIVSDCTYTRKIRFDDDGSERWVLFSRTNAIENDDNIFFYGLDPEQAIIGMRNDYGGWEIVG